MPTILQILENDAFQLSSLTAAIQKLPYQERRLGELGLFETNPLETNVVVIDEEEGQIQLFGTKPRGSTPQAPLKDKDRKARSFIVPHIPVKDRVLAASLLGKRRTGQTDLESVVEKINDRFSYMRNQMENTFEIHRLNALKGIVVDADGSELLNCYTAFDVTPNTEDFVFSDATFPVREAIVSVVREIEDTLGGVPYSRIHALCGRNWFDALTQHPLVRDTFINQQSITLRGDLRQGFDFGSVTFEEYRGMRGLPGGIGQIDDDEALFFPVGVAGMYRANFAPGDFMETVNTLGEELYARIAPDRDLNKYVDLYLETNPLLLNTRPNAVVTVTKS